MAYLIFYNSQMPTQNYKNNDINKYLEPQTSTSLKKNYIMFMMKSKLRKTVWIMNEISNSIVYKFVSTKTKENVKIGTLFPTLLERKKR